VAAKYTLVIHAGCEGITRQYYGPEAEQEHLAFLRKSLAARRTVLDGGGRGLDAVCQLCETSADKVDAVKLEIPEGFKFLKLKLMEVL